MCVQAESEKPTPFMGGSFTSLMAKGTDESYLNKLHIRYNQTIENYEENGEEDFDIWKENLRRGKYDDWLKKHKVSLTAKGFKANSDDKMHERAFERDEERVSSSLTPSKVEYLINDEHKATKEYKGLGLESLSHDEARHEHLLKKLKKENKMSLTSSGAVWVKPTSTWNGMIRDYKTAGWKVKVSDGKIFVKRTGKSVRVRPFGSLASRGKTRLRGLILSGHTKDYDVYYDRKGHSYMFDGNRLTRLTSRGKKVHTAKFDRCVKAVLRKSGGKVNPFAVCSKSIKYEDNILQSHRRRPLKVLGLVVAGVGGYAVAKHYQRKHRREAEARRNRRIG